MTMKEFVVEYAGKALRFADAQCLPLGLILGLFFGLLVPIVGTTIGQKGVMSFICVIVIFLVSGLKLNTQEAKAALGSYKSIIYGITSIMVLTSLLGSFLTSFLPLEPAEFKTGIIIFFCTPCAIAYSVILTKQVVSPIFIYGLILQLIRIVSARLAVMWR